MSSVSIEHKYIAWAYFFVKKRFTKETILRYLYLYKAKKSIKKHNTSMITNMLLF